jgi:hypothetical protein
MTANDEAIFEAVVFLDHFSDLPDPRQLIKVIYPLDEVLLQSLLAVLAGAETFTDIARFGENKLDLLRRFRPFARETPTHDRLGEIFAAHDAERFQQCFVAWMASYNGDLGGGDRHRRQDQPALLPEEGRQRADPHCLGLEG